MTDSVFVKSLALQIPLSGLTLTQHHLLSIYIITYILFMYIQFLTQQDLSLFYHYLFLWIGMASWLEHNKLLAIDWLSKLNHANPFHRK